MERIEAYDDYRRFLREFYDDRKKRNRAFSHRAFSLKAGLASPSHLREVIDGKRNLTDLTIPLFVKGLGLGEIDARFFGFLVRYNQSTDPAQRRECLDGMRAIRRKVPALAVSRDRWDYYSRWYHPVLRELATHRDWGEDWAAMGRAARPPLDAVQVREGIELLERLGFLRREGARWVQTDPVITTGDDFDPQAVRAGNREYARLGMEAIGTQTPSQRDITSVILGLSAEGARQVRSEIREFKDRVARIAHSDRGLDRVCALNVQLFLLSDPEGGEG